jgi:magnesium and cobalt transporter
MGDSNDESSNAAQRAQSDDQESEGEQGGFFRRIFGALSSSDESESQERHVDTKSGAAIPGLGNLRSLTVEDVAIPKAEIVSVPATITKDELVQLFRDSGLTRLPVYEGTLDTPIGMVHLKDFALRHGFNGTSGRFSLKKMLRPLLFVPPSMTIGVLLQKMQAERRHMALVIDEGHYWSLEKPGSYVAQAKAPLEEFEAEIGMSLTAAEEIDEEEIDTLGGLVFMLLGRVPVRGELVEHPSGVEIEVLDADPRRIKRLRVRLPGHGEG